MVGLTRGTEGPLPRRTKQGARDGRLFIENDVRLQLLYADLVKLQQQREAKSVNLHLNRAPAKKAQVFDFQLQNQIAAGVGSAPTGTPPSSVGRSN